MKRPSLNQNGQILVSLIIVVPSLILIATAYMSLSVSSLKLARQDQLHTHAQISADAGIDYAIEQFNQDSSWTSTLGEVTLHNDGSIRTTYSASVITNSATSKTIVSTGRSYRPATAASASSSVTIKADLRPVESGTYSVVSGEGGLFMSNNSKITGGDVFINGTVSLKNNAQIGLSTKSVNVTVANEACPQPATAAFPRLCASGEGAQPIILQNGSLIYGSVKANNQVSGAGMSNPGLVGSSGIVPQPLPTHDRAAQKAAAVNNLTGAAASCGSGIKTWTAHTKITGDVNISGSCVVTVQGDVWITGSLTMDNSSQMKVADSLGTTLPNIMVDGTTGTQTACKDESNNKIVGACFMTNSKLVSNTSNTGFEIFTYNNKAPCSPDCSTITGTDLYNSQRYTTLVIQNNAEAPQTVLYAYWSMVQVSSNGQIGALIGQSINLNNNGTITFGSSAPGASTTSWVIKGYRRSFN